MAPYEFVLPNLITFGSKPTAEGKAPRFMVSRSTDNPEQVVEEFAENLSLEKSSGNTVSYWLETEQGTRTGGVGVGPSHRNNDIYVEAVGVSTDYPAQVDEALKWI